mgnify:CR=1 FL=1
MLENLKKYKIVLASNSPRRRNLLSGLDIDFEVRVIPDIDESYPDSIDSMEIPLYIARSKAEAYKSTMADDELLITADTIVWTFDGVMGKPANREEAYAMLHALSDHVHQVITGVCIMTKDKNVGFSSNLRFVSQNWVMKRLIIIWININLMIKREGMAFRSGSVISG